MCPAQVYPRAYGGTSRSGTVLISATGLSPRVRGNLRRLRSRCSVRRSIPARTGEPVSPIWTRTLTTVYPRAYGGTQALHRLLAHTQGLSPRVRGNPVLVGRSLDNRRSIPARTGEPKLGGLPVEFGGVYPRAYGGTESLRLRPVVFGGLSPRVRGNRECGVVREAYQGSIPARTGEPRNTARWDRRTWVYPRAYGGTIGPSPRISLRYGLSPRVRGNLRSRSESRSGSGSIPARTGEPVVRGIDIR